MIASRLAMAAIVNINGHGQGTADSSFRSTTNNTAEKLMMLLTMQMLASRSSDANVTKDDQSRINMHQNQRGFLQPILLCRHHQSQINLNQNQRG